jgi:hypothetical protein
VKRIERERLRKELKESTKGIEREIARKGLKEREHEKD